MPTLRDLLRSQLGLVAFAALMLTGRAALADHYVVPTSSMHPTVHVGDRVLVDKRAYGLRLPLTQTYLTRAAEPALGDVVVLDSPEDGTVLLKRVVATPGTEVAVRRGRLILDGREQPVSAEGEVLGQVQHPVRFVPDGGPDLGPLVVPTDAYLVMGDNRGESYDGRYFGLVERGAILGRVAKIYWRDGAPSWIALP